MSSEELLTFVSLMYVDESFNIFESVMDYYPSLKWLIIVELKVIGIS